MPMDRKTRAALNHLDMVIADIERTIDQSESREKWREAMRGVMVHWLAVLYEEGAGHTKDLETSLAILRNQVEQLRKQGGL